MLGIDDNATNRTFLASRLSAWGAPQSVTSFYGQLVDVVIYPLHAEDTTLAWERTAACAARQMLNVESEDLYREGLFYANVSSESS